MLQQAGLANVMGAPMAGMSPSPVANPMASQTTTISQEGTAHYCSVALPDRQPTASRDSPIARRVFIVSHPERFSDDVLRDAFCRFGNLIDAYFVPGKSFMLHARYLTLSVRFWTFFIHGLQPSCMRLQLFDDCLQHAEDFVF